MPYMTGANASQNGLEGAGEKFAADPFIRPAPRPTIATSARTFSDVKAMAVAELPFRVTAFRAVTSSTITQATTWGLHDTPRRASKWLAKVSPTAAAAK